MCFKSIDVFQVYVSQCGKTQHVRTWLSLSLPISLQGLVHCNYCNTKASQTLASKAPEHQPKIPE